MSNVAQQLTPTQASLSLSQNSVINPNFNGVVAGSPGTFTNWTETPVNAGTVARTINGSARQGGIPYVDVRYAGTAGVGGVILLIADAFAGAAQNQRWRCSGSLITITGLTFPAANTIIPAINIAEYNSGAFLTNGALTLVTPVYSDLKNGRFTFDYTLTNASTNQIAPYFTWTFFDLAIVDATFRIGRLKLRRLL